MGGQTMTPSDQITGFRLSGELRNPRRGEYFIDRAIGDNRHFRQRDGDYEIVDLTDGTQTARTANRKV